MKLRATIISLFLLSLGPAWEVWRSTDEYPVIVTPSSHQDPEWNRYDNWNLPGPSHSIDEALYHEMWF